MGGRDQEMTFGIGKIDYSALYLADANERTIEQAITTGTAVDGPNKGSKFHLAHLPSDAVTIKENGKLIGVKETVDFESREVANEDDRKKHEKELMEKATAAASIKEELDGQEED